MSGDSRRIWAAVKDLLHGESTCDVGKPDANAAYCRTLAAFFVNKVRNIRSVIATTLAGRNPTPLSSDVPHQGQGQLSEFTPVTPMEVQRVLKSMPSKSSPLDVVPTSLLKTCSDGFSIIIANLANITFQRGYFPTKFKTAQITPLIKQHGLDPDDPSSYRPISNLNTISKILERLVLARVTLHISSLSSIDRFQSAYKRAHSTETALLRVTNDIFNAFDAGQSTVLVALDLSAAFDCIEHSTLLSRLQYTYGLTGAALDWMTSYLDSRRSYVRWKDCVSDHAAVDAGVPQGSSLGPQLFSMYIAPLAGLIRSFGVRYHQYADDTQLYIEISKDNADVRLSMLEQCILSVYEWLLHNGLALNPSKSDAIQFTTGRVRGGVDIATVSVSGVAIKPAETVKSLGVVFDVLTFDQQVNNVCKTCYFHIRALRHLRCSPPDYVAKTVACSNTARLL